jgi:hypothetical protein
MQCGHRQPAGHRLAQQRPVDIASSQQHPIIALEWQAMRTDDILISNELLSERFYWFHIIVKLDYFFLNNFIE